MWQFLCGCASGIYIGTYYDCKPAIEFIKDTIKNRFPEKKDK